MEAGSDANAAFVPLRPAAKANLRDEASTGEPHANGEGEAISAPRQIEEHEVEMYKEQDVSTVDLCDPLTSSSPTRSAH